MMLELPAVCVWTLTWMHTNTEEWAGFEVVTMDDPWVKIHLDWMIVSMQLGL